MRADRPTLLLNTIMKNYTPASFGKVLRAFGLAGTGLSLCLTASAQDQTNKEPGTLTLERFVVTGSNIPSTEMAAEARTFPVQTIDRALIEQSGVFTTTELLQRMSLSNGGGVPLTNNATGFTPGATAPSLRGLGPDYTLTLVNGRRLAPYPVGHNGTSAFVDINSIPLAAIERIEILKDGASAVYGADAVAGVVNIILRKNYNGAVASVSYGNTTERDSSDVNASVIWGAGNDKGNLMIGVNYQSRQAIFQRDRPYSAVPAFLSSNSSPPNLQLSRAAVEEALGLPPGGAIPGIAAGTNVFFGTTGPNEPNSLVPLPGNQNANNNGNLPASAYTYSNGRLSSYNFNEAAGSLPEITRKGLFASWERKLYSPNVRAYGDAFFQQVVQVDELAPYATGNFASPGQTTVVIPARTSNPILTPAEIAAGGMRTATAGAFNPANPFNQDISGSSRIRLAEFGNRIFKNRNTAFAVTGGLRVDNIADKWNFDSSIRFSSITNNLNAQLISTSRFLRAMNAADPIFNPSSPSYIGTTQPYNPFGYYRNAIASNSAPVAFATHFQRDENTARLVDMGATLSTGNLMEIAGGDVGFALGTEFYRESITQLPDSALQSGDILASPPSSPISRQRKIGSVFSEVEVPFVSEKNAMSGVHRLSLNLAARYEKFFTSKRTTFVPKVGLRWEPLADGSLVFRGSYGEGFKEPSLYQLYSPPVAGLTPIHDPLTDTDEPEQAVTDAGNPALQAEDSKSVNVGLVWSPKGALDGFTWSMDVWQIEQTGQVSINEQDVVDRAVAGQPLVPGESIVRDFAGNLIQVNAVFRNLGVTKVKGLDFSGSYLWKTANVGQFEGGVTATYMDSYRQSADVSQPLVELIDTEVPGTAGDDAYLKWKAIGFLSWNYKGINSRLQANYTHGFQDFDANGDPFRVKATTTFDLQVAYLLFPSKGKAGDRWFSDTKVTLGCNNLFDKAPPFASSFAANSNGYPGFIYNATGRFVYCGIEKKL
jgi:iron complex outermembrane receptor protein